MNAQNSCPDAVGQVSSEGTIVRIALAPPFDHEIGGWGGGVVRRSLGACRFVPLVGEEAWPEGSN